MNQSVKIIILTKDKIQQNLYVTVNEKVEFPKIGDWVIEFYGMPGAYKLRRYISELGNCVEKIIATTDSNLHICGESNCIKNLCTFPDCMYPSLQQSFLEEFGFNPDGEFEVEYETAGDWVPCKINSEKLGEKCKKCEELNYSSNLECNCGFKPKINQNNTVNITSVEEKISLKKAKKYAKQQHYLGTQGKDLVEFEDW
tara:strand:+ start:236 stop:832 length:597 start_codon:yes stop_codon:yes gene_type:complete